MPVAAVAYSLLLPLAGFVLAAGFASVTSAGDGVGVALASTGFATGMLCCRIVQRAARRNLSATRRIGGDRMEPGPGGRGLESC